jgi:hypothetical protein
MMRTSQKNRRAENKKILRELEAFMKAHGGAIGQSPNQADE